MSENLARDVAGKVLTSLPATKSSSDLKLIWTGEGPATKASVQPAFYVFGRESGGFVIISGDDNVRPVLGLSQTSRFKAEGMPDNVRWWMDQMKDYVRKAAGNAAPTHQARQQWAQFIETKSGPAAAATDVTDKVERLTPEWDQGNNDQTRFGRNVFNVFCPMDGANIAVAAANATDDLMFYNVFGAVSFTLKGTGAIKQVNLYTRGEDALCGNLSVNFPSGTFVGSVVGEGEQYRRLSLDCGSGVALNDGDGVTFCLSVPAGVFASGGFFVEFIDDEGSAMIKSAGASPNNVIRRAGLTTMSAFEYKAQYNAAFLQEADDFAAYSSVGKGAAAKVCTYTEGVSQYAVQNTPGDPGSRYVRFQDLDAGYALSLTISSLAIEQNAKPQVAVKALGATGDIASKDAAEMKVVKKTASHAWIVDNADKNGYVIKLAD